MYIKAYSTKLILVILAAAFAGLAAEAQEARKEITRNYRIGKGTTLSTETRYSDIEMVTWDRDEVDILVEVTVKASSQSRAEERLDKIDVTMEKPGNTISLETEFDNGWSDHVETDIRITIQAPAYINLDMENSYGDLFIQEVSGLVLLDLKYCNLVAGTLSRGNARPYNLMEIAYSDASIDRAGWIEIEQAYSETEIGESDMLFVESKYSKLLGERAGSISAEGAYDKYAFDEIGAFAAELKYSGIKFGTLQKKLDLESMYTNVRIQQLNRGFQEVRATLAYGNIHLGVEQPSSYKFEGMAKYGRINVSQEGRLNQEKDGTTMRVWGQVGANPKGSVNLVTKYGNIRIE